MATSKKLNAYVRYDGTGRVVAGSLILQRKKPKDGNWKQINAYECCSPTCLPPVYEEDFIIGDIIETPEGIVFQIYTNPFTGVVLQVCIVSCESTPPNRIIPLQIETIPSGSAPYSYIVPNDILEQGCALGLRRVCVPGYSGWNIGL